MRPLGLVHWQASWPLSTPSGQDVSLGEEESHQSHHLLQEEGPLPGPETGLLPNTRKRIVRGDICADKARDSTGKGHPGGEQQGKEPRSAALWLAVSGFMVMGLASRLSLANHSDSESFLAVHTLFSQMDAREDSGGWSDTWYLLLTFPKFFWFIVAYYFFISYQTFLLFVTKHALIDTGSISHFLLMGGILAGVLTLGIPLPYCSPPGCPFPVKSLALSALVSPRIIHFRVLDKSPVSGPGRDPSSCNKCDSGGDSSLLRLAS